MHIDSKNTQKSTRKIAKNHQIHTLIVHLIRWKGGKGVGDIGSVEWRRGKEGKRQSLSGERVGKKGKWQRGAEEWDQDSRWGKAILAAVPLLSKTKQLPIKY